MLAYNRSPSLNLSCMQLSVSNEGKSRTQAEPTLYGSLCKQKTKKWSWAKPLNMRRVSPVFPSWSNKMVAVGGVKWFYILSAASCWGDFALVLWFPLSCPPTPREILASTSWEGAPSGKVTELQGCFSTSSPSGGESTRHKARGTLRLRQPPSKGQRGASPSRRLA